jgi:hypothetical protein
MDSKLAILLKIKGLLNGHRTSVEEMKALEENFNKIDESNPDKYEEYLDISFEIGKKFEEQERIAQELKELQAQYRSL